jgi:hypothetical protein
MGEAVNLNLFDDRLSQQDAYCLDYLPIVRQRILTAQEVCARLIAGGVVASNDALDYSEPFVERLGMAPNDNHYYAFLPLSATQFISNPLVQRLVQQALQLGKVTAHFDEWPFHPIPNPPYACRISIRKICGHDFKSSFNRYLQKAFLQVLAGGKSIGPSVAALCLHKVDPHVVIVCKISHRGITCVGTNDKQINLVNHLCIRCHFESSYYRERQIPVLMCALAKAGVLSFDISFRSILVIAEPSLFRSAVFSPASTKLFIGCRTDEIVHYAVTLMHAAMLTCSAHTQDISVGNDNNSWMRFITSKSMQYMIANRPIRSSLLLNMLFKLRLLFDGDYVRVIDENYYCRYSNKELLPENITRSIHVMQFGWDNNQVECHHVLDCFLVALSKSTNCFQTLRPHVPSISHMPTRLIVAILRLSGYHIDAHCPLFTELCDDLCEVESFPPQLYPPTQPLVDRSSLALRAIAYSTITQ